VRAIIKKDKSIVEYKHYKPLYLHSASIPKAAEIVLSTVSVFHTESAHRNFFTTFKSNCSEDKYLHYVMLFHIATTHFGSIYTYFKSKQRWP